MHQKIEDFNNQFDRGSMLANPNRVAMANGVVQAPIPSVEQLLAIKVRCETLRDGLQGTFLSPAEKAQIKFIKLQRDLGLNAVSVGVYSSPGLNNLSLQDKRTLRVLEHLAQKMPDLMPVLVVRAAQPDIDFLKLCQEKNSSIAALIYQGNSPLRRFVQAWGESAEVLKNLADKVGQARKAGIRVLSFTEDTVRTPENEIREYVKAMLAVDVTWVGIADTVGDLLPFGAYYLVARVGEMIEQEGGKQGIFFHGHNDNGTAVQNSLAAIAAGAEWVDVVVNGVGERSGNTDQFQLFNIMVTLLRNYSSSDERYDRKKFFRIAKQVEKMIGVPIPGHAPVVGGRAFTTSSGVHADAELKVERELVKVKREGATEQELWEYRKRLEQVYASVSPIEFGRRTEVKLSPMSGTANAILSLYYMDLIDDDQLMEMPKNHPVVLDLLDYAKRSGRELSANEIKRRFDDDYWRYFKKDNLKTEKSLRKVESETII